MSDMNIFWEIVRYQKQFLLHSFLYYVLNESIITDSEYDRRCKKLIFLQQEHSIIAKTTPYFSTTSKLDDSGSGFFLKMDDYPPDLIATAFRLLYSEKLKKGLIHPNMDYVLFLKSYGYSWEAYINA